MVCFPSNSSPSESGANCLMEIAVVAEYQVNHSRRQRNHSQVISLVVAENKKENRKFKRNSPSATLDTKTSIVNYFINLLGLVIKKNLLANFSCQLLQEERHLSLDISSGQNIFLRVISSSF